jgi:hypothetical protein
MHHRKRAEKKRMKVVETLSRLPLKIQENKTKVQPIIIDVYQSIASLRLHCSN